MSYPEHDKLAAVSDESQAIGAFLDATPYTLCQWRDAGDNGEPRYVWAARFAELNESKEPNGHDFLNGHANQNPEFDVWDAGFYPVGGGITLLLAEHFGIDLDILENEKRAMLDAQRALNAEVRGGG